MVMIAIVSNGVCNIVCSECVMDINRGLFYPQGLKPNSYWLAKVERIIFASIFATIIIRAPRKTLIDNGIICVVFILVSSKIDAVNII